MMINQIPKRYENRQLPFLWHRHHLSVGDFDSDGLRLLQKHIDPPRSGLGKSRRDGRAAARFLADPARNRRGLPQYRFSVVGRIQLRYHQGLWNEWYLLFENQRSGWLGEMLGNYVVTFIVQPLEPLPPLRRTAGRSPYNAPGPRLSGHNIENARCIAGEGGLPVRVGPVTKRRWWICRPAAGYSRYTGLQREPAAGFYRRAAHFDDLKLTQLREVMPVGWNPDVGIQAQSFRVQVAAVR